MDGKKPKCIFCQISSGLEGTTSDDYVSSNKDIRFHPSFKTGTELLYSDTDYAVFRDHKPGTSKYKSFTERVLNINNSTFNDKFQLFAVLSDRSNLVD